MKQYRSFWQYNKDNKMIFGVWGVTLILGIAAWGESTAMSLFFFGVGIISLLASLRDWRKNG